LSIKIKIVFIALPILITSLLVTGFATTLSAEKGVKVIAERFLGFKAEMLDNYIKNQWHLLEKNDISRDKRYVEAVKHSVAEYAAKILSRGSELIIAFDREGNQVLPEPEKKVINISEKEKKIIMNNISGKKSGWTEIELSGVDRVGNGIFFNNFGWYILVTDEKDTFYSSVRLIIMQSSVIMAVTSILSLFVLIVFSNYLMRPLSKVVTAMKDIISKNDLSRRVEVEFKDETGRLAHTFNIMTAELEKLHIRIKDFALKAVLAKKKEQKIRNIFQKYVPKSVIENIFKNPESMLVGENRVMVILFSDIRSFTTISEGFAPDELVSSLNRYFTMMVDIIMKHGGIIDKYIGDAIMAFFGAPVKHEDDVFHSVLAGLEMQDALKEFNIDQINRGKPGFQIGVGLNYGVVTVGNIGSDKKMDYTVIGDMVNLASRLEGLTKKYKQWMIISASIHRKVKDRVKCRLLDTVIVKGKTTGEKIYTAKKVLTENEEKGWKYHHAGLKYYYNREFKEALRYFLTVKKFIPNDYIADLFLKRCRQFIKTPPPQAWNGTVKMEEK